MEKVEQVVKQVDEFLAKYPSVTQFGRWNSTLEKRISFPFTVILRAWHSSASEFGFRGLRYWIYGKILVHEKDFCPHDGWVQNSAGRFCS